MVDRPKALEAAETVPPCPEPCYHLPSSSPLLPCISVLPQ